MGKQKITDKDIKKIIDLYLQGYSIYEVACKIDFSQSTVSRYLKQNNIPIRDGFIPQELVDKILLLYMQGYSQEKIELITGVSRPIVRKYLKLNNIPIRNQTETSRKYTLNEYYFQELDHQNKYWILGFFYADGNISKSDANIQMDLQEQDIDALEKIKKEFNSNRPLYFNERNSQNSKHQNIVLLSIDSIIMQNDLKKWGIIPNKTHLIKYPEFIPDNMQSHFLRGVLDGDGTIGKTKSGTHRCRNVEICGTYDFCMGVKEVVERLVGVHVCVSSASRSKRTYKACVSGIYNSIKFLLWIYQDAKLYLNRKHQIFLDYYINEIQSA